MYGVRSTRSTIFSPRGVLHNLFFFSRIGVGQFRQVSFPPGSLLFDVKARAHTRNAGSFDPIRNGPGRSGARTWNMRVAVDFDSSSHRHKTHSGFLLKRRKHQSACALNKKRRRGPKWLMRRSAREGHARHIVVLRIIRTRYVVSVPKLGLFQRAGPISCHPGPDDAPAARLTGPASRAPCASQCVCFILRNPYSLRTPCILHT